MLAVVAFQRLRHGYHYAAIQRLGGVLTPLQLVQLYVPLFIDPAVHSSTHCMFNTPFSKSTLCLHGHELENVLRSRRNPTSGHLAALGRLGEGSSVLASAAKRDQPGGGLCCEGKSTKQCTYIDGSDADGDNFEVCYVRGEPINTTQRKTNMIVQYSPEPVRPTTISDGDATVMECMRNVHIEQDTTYIGVRGSFCEGSDTGGFSLRPVLPFCAHDTKCEGVARHG